MADRDDTETLSFCGSLITIPALGSTISMTSRQYARSAVKIKRPGGYVQEIYRPITAQEVMLHNPKHWVTKLGLFRSHTPGQEVVLPETVLMPGQTFLLVPFKTVRRLLKRTGYSPESLDRSMDRPGLAIRDWYMHQMRKTAAKSKKSLCSLSSSTPRQQLASRDTASRKKASLQSTAFDSREARKPGGASRDGEQANEQASKQEICSYNAIQDEMSPKNRQRAMQEHPGRLQRVGEDDEIREVEAKEQMKQEDSFEQSENQTVPLIRKRISIISPKLLALAELLRKSYLNRKVS